MIKHVIWDWNGTLIDDVELCVDILNHFLLCHQKPTLSVEWYRDSFFFPVADFYASVGLPSQGAKYDQLASDYIIKYRERFFECKLQQGALQTIQNLDSFEISQSILTAGMQTDIERFAAHYRISEYMISIDGSDNISAAGKLDRIDSHFCKLGLDPSEVVIVGDTLHDWQVSDRANCKSFLFNKGHTSLKRLSEVKVPVLNSLTELIYLVRS